MTTIKVTMDPRGIRATFRSEEVNDALYAEGSRIAEQATSALNSRIHGAPFTQPYKCVTKRLPNSCVAQIRPSSLRMMKAGDALNIFDNFR